MNGVNLFQQQAEVLKYTKNWTQPEASNVKIIDEMDFVRQVIERASLSELKNIVSVVGKRLSHFKSIHTGMAEANIGEAIDMISDVLIDLQGAIDAKGETVCQCGVCDSCRATKSDEAHGLAVDALAANREAAGRKS